MCLASPLLQWNHVLPHLCCCCRFVLASSPATRNWLDLSEFSTTSVHLGLPQEPVRERVSAWYLKLYLSLQPTWQCVDPITFELSAGASVFIICGLHVTSCTRPVRRQRAILHNRILVFLSPSLSSYVVICHIFIFYFVVRSLPPWRTCRHMKPPCHGDT